MMRLEAAAVADGAINATDARDSGLGGVVNVGRPIAI